MRGWISAALGLVLGFSAAVAAAADPLPLPPLNLLAPSPTPTPQPTPSPQPAPGGERAVERPLPPAPSSRQEMALPNPLPPPGLSGAREPQGPVRRTDPILSYIPELHSLGVDPGEAARRILAPFPVAAPAWYLDDWHAPRLNPYPHLHTGTDIFAAEGSPVVASASGVVARLAEEFLGGIVLYLAGDDGVVYYYAHLSGYAPGIEEGRRVALGDLVAFVGNTGNAQGGPPHLHFQVHPGGGPPVSPVPLLDSWLAGAPSRARAMLEEARSRAWWRGEIPFRLRLVTETLADGPPPEALARLDEIRAERLARLLPPEEREAFLASGPPVLASG